MKIYLEAIEMLAEVDKFVEMEEKIKKLRMKFKHELQMWLRLGKIYYSCGKFQEARQLQGFAIKSIPDKKQRMSFFYLKSFTNIMHIIVKCNTTRNIYFKNILRL